MEIIDYNGVGYKAVLDFESWRVAYLNYAECFDKITKLERHMCTDEAFILLEGEATLIIGQEQQKHKMEIHKIYNVAKAEWHNIKVSRDAKVLIVENRNTTAENSEYIYFDKPIDM